MWPFRRKDPYVELIETRDRWSLDQKLIRFSKSDAITLGDTFENVLICGEIGSGKTTGSGDALADALLRADCGFLVLTVKPTETDLWRLRAKRAGRLKDLVVFGPEQPWRFNAIDYELRRGGRGAGQTENIVSLLTTLAELGGRGSSEEGGRREVAFFRQARDQLARAMIDLLAMSVGRITIADMYELLVSAPKSEELIYSDKWKARSFCYQCIVEALERVKTPKQKQAFDAIENYWLGTYAQTPSDTRGNIDITFSAMFDVLNRGIARQMFSEGTNLTPVAAENGKIIVIDVPSKVFGDAAILAAGLWKHCFQKSVEKRDVRRSPRPVVLWADDGHFFITPKQDMDFLSTNRAARASSILLTQTISNVYAMLGGQTGPAEANSLFSCMVTKIFHANDSFTNNWAAEQIGHTKQFLVNVNSSFQQADMFDRLMGNGFPQINAGVSETIAHEVPPRAFTTLRTGGRKNNRLVDAIVFQSGRVFSDTRRPWRYATFRQRK